MNTINKMILTFLVSFMGGIGMLQAASARSLAASDYTLLCVQQRAMGAVLSPGCLVRPYYNSSSHVLDVEYYIIDSAIAKTLSDACGPHNPTELDDRSTTVLGDSEARFEGDAAKVLGGKLLQAKDHATKRWLEKGDGIEWQLFKKRLEVVLDDIEWEKWKWLPGEGERVETFRADIAKIAEANGHPLPATPATLHGAGLAPKSEQSALHYAHKAKRNTWSKWLANTTIASAAGLVMFNKFRQK